MAPELSRLVVCRRILPNLKVPYMKEYLLDLEREAFLSLVAEPKSQARMQNMLVKGKPLRN